MRSYDAATLAAFGNRSALIAHRLVWIEARNRATSQVEALGVWTGEDDLTVTIDGEARTYLGCGTVLGGDPVQASPGLAVRIHQVRLAGVSAEIETHVKGYDTRFVPGQVHRAILDPDTRQLVGAPHRVFLGIINGISFPRAEAGGEGLCIVDLASETRQLTRTLPTKKSDDSHKARGGDRFRRYGDVSGAVPVYWGELRAEAPAAQPPGGPAEPEPAGSFVGTPHGR